MGKKFWNFTENNGSRVLYLDGIIAAETWWGDEVTPALFKSELQSAKGDITVWLNSPGGDCVAASQIYSMLADYSSKAGTVTIKIDGLAASAASVIAMSGDSVPMSPTALMMVHNPLTVAVGDSGEMTKTAAMLDEVKESIINAYQLKTGQSREKLAEFMNSETWMSAHKAVELGFADEIIAETRLYPDRISYLPSVSGRAIIGVRTPFARTLFTISVNRCSSGA